MSYLMFAPNVNDAFNPGAMYRISALTAFLINDAGEQCARVLYSDGTFGIVTTKSITVEEA